MIFLTRLDGRELVINDELVVTVETTPDTVITLTNGDRIMVKEPASEFVAKVVAFRQRVLGQGPDRVLPEGQVSPPSADEDPMSKSSSGDDGPANDNPDTR